MTKKQKDGSKDKDDRGIRNHFEHPSLPYNNFEMPIHYYG